MRRLIKWFILKLKIFRIAISVWKQKSPYIKIPFFQKICANFRGFSARHYALYNFKENNYKEYLNEIDRWRTREINGKYNILLDDKLVFYDLFKEYLNVPEAIMWIKDQKIYNLKGTILNKKEFLNILENKKKLIIKPNYGGGGKGIFTLEWDHNNSIFLNDSFSSENEVVSKLNKLDNYVVFEYIDQHKYSRDIFSETINSIRVVTTLDSNGTVDIPIAIHRFGTIKSIPVDNASQGGIFSKIDIDNGEISASKSYRIIDEFEYHPDTKVKIKGVIVPNWEHIKQKVVSVAKIFPYIPFMAWDIVPTEDGFYVLEINASTELTLIQMFGPQRYNKLGEFYRERGVVK